MRSKSPLLSGVALIIGLAVLLSLGNKWRRDAKLYGNELDKQFAKRELELQTALQKSDSEKQILAVRFDSIVRRSDSLDRKVSELDRELESIPGSHNNKNSQQLEAEMIKRFNTRK